MSNRRSVRADQRREIFIIEYLKDLNGTRACLAAGYTKNEKSAATQASRLLSNVDVRKEIARLQKPRLKKAQITGERVLEELARIAFSDVTKVAQWNEKRIGKTRYKRMEISLRESKTLPPSVRAAISEISEGQGGRIKLKMHNKVQALEKLAQHLGLLGVDPMTGTSTAPVRREMKWVTSAFDNAAPVDAEVVTDAKPTLSPPATAVEFADIYDKPKTGTG